MQHLIWTHFPRICGCRGHVQQKARKIERFGPQVLRSRENLPSRDLASPDVEQQRQWLRAWRFPSPRSRFIEEEDPLINESSPCHKYHQTYHIISIKVGEFQRYSGYHIPPLRVRHQCRYPVRLRHSHIQPEASRGKNEGLDPLSTRSTISRSSRFVVSKRVRKNTGPSPFYRRC